MPRLRKTKEEALVWAQFERVQSREEQHGWEWIGAAELLSYGNCMKQSLKGLGMR